MTAATFLAVLAGALSGPLVPGCAHIVATFTGGRRDVIPVLTSLRPGWG